MRILIDPGGYGCCNMGDVAMFQVALARFEQQWPAAEVVAFTSAPDRLRRYAPRVLPCSPQAREELLAAHHPNRGLGQRLPLSMRLSWDLHRLLASAAAGNWKQISDAARRRVGPRPARGGFTSDLERRNKEGLRGTLSSFSLVAVSGAGGLCDSFLPHAWSVLELLQIAASANVPTALFGQGIGPMRNPALRSKARSVLPHVDFVALRERRKGLHLLHDLGVPASLIHVTGDDAIELAYRRHHTQTAASCLGVNLRLADYAHVNRALASSVLGIVAEFARAGGLEVLPIPISFDDDEADSRAVASALGVSKPFPCQDEPAAVVGLVGRCRLVVTGSYHGAVFALAQGIPVVALSNSLYYTDKFLGLADMFGAGCQVVDLSDAAAPQKLRAALHELSDTSANLRDTLVRSACEQIAASQAAYQRVFEIVSSRPLPTNALACHS